MSNSITDEITLVTALGGWESGLTNCEPMHPI